MNFGTIILGACGLLFLTILAVSCSEDLVFDNPYDEVDYGSDGPEGEELDPFIITSLHRDIFQARCALPGCHDGHFEPDFRTVQSTYSTLVYHPIIKNNAENEFRYRVVPFAPEESVLIERLTNCCFVNQDDRMPQDNIGVPLDDELLERIRQWIQNGAPDIFGNNPELPNTSVRILFFVAIDEALDSVYSENRTSEFSPFALPRNENVNLVVGLVDDKTPISELTNNRIEISTRPQDFSSAITINAEYFDFEQFGEFWIAAINTGNFLTNQVYFFRIYANDGSQLEDTEFPSDELPRAYKTFFSFIIP